MASTRKPPHDELRARVDAHVDGRIARGARVCVGYSGGVDSTVLLHVLLGLADARGWRLSALHVHHGLSVHADAWAAHCAAQCRAWGVALDIARVQVTREHGEGLEAAARRARYAAFEQAGTDVVALAHHADDQAETVLLQLARGAGVDGLASMPAARPLGAGGLLLRPLLESRRAAIVDYANAHGLAWVEDDSNADERLRRNFVRRQLLPRVAQLQPAAVENLARSARLLGEAATLIRALAEQDAAAARLGEGWRIKALAALGPARAANALRAILASQGMAPPSARQLEALWRQLVGARDGARVAVRLQGRVVRRYRGMFFVHLDAPTDTPTQSAWNGAPEWPLPAFGGVLTLTRARGLGIAAERLAGATLLARARSGGERFRPAGAAHHRTLKNLFQEHAVAPWERDRAPLLYVNEVLAWVPGVGVGAEFAAGPAAEGVVPRWQPWVGKATA